MSPRPIPLVTAAAAALSAIVTLGAVPSAAAGPMPAIGASAAPTVLRGTSAGRPPSPLPPTPRHR